MSKASIDTSLTEALIYEAPTMEIATKIRSELINNFSNCWFFLYTNNNKLFATNEWGGRLQPDVLQALQNHAMEIAATLLEVKMEVS